MQGFWFRATRLNHLGKVLHAMDMAIVREGGVDNLTQDSIRIACIIRGEYSTNFLIMIVDLFNIYLNRFKSIKYEA